MTGEQPEGDRVGVNVTPDGDIVLACASHGGVSFCQMQFAPETAAAIGKKMCELSARLKSGLVVAPAGSVPENGKRVQ